MTFRFDNILEDWAAMYKPLSHNKEKGSKDKRFFRIKTLSTDNEWGRNANTHKSPCMLFSVMVDAQTNGNPKQVDYLYSIFFVSKAQARSLARNSKQDDDVATDQQLDMDEMVLDLLAYLHTIKTTGVCPITNKAFDSETRNALKGLELNKAEWASLPVKFNEWHVMGLNIEQTVPRLQCVTIEKYEV